MKLLRGGNRVIEAYRPSDPNRGLVAKKPSHGDKRLIELFLTEAGKELMSELLPLAADFQKKIEVHLGQSLKGFELGLDALLSEFGDP